VNVVLAVPLQRESACPARPVQAGAVRSSDITPLVAVSLTRWGPRHQAHSYDRDPHAAAVRSTDRHRCWCNAWDADVLVRLPRPGRSPGCRHTIRVEGGLGLASTGSQPVRRRTYCNPSPLRGMRPWYACTIDGNFRLAQAAPCSPNRAAVEPADRMGDEEGHGIAPSPGGAKGPSLWPSTSSLPVGAGPWLGVRDAGGVAGAFFERSVVGCARPHTRRGPSAPTPG
jgi:hypothetical protein